MNVSEQNRYKVTGYIAYHLLPVSALFVICSLVSLFGEVDLFPNEASAWVCFAAALIAVLLPMLSMLLMRFGAPKLFGHAIMLGALAEAALTTIFFGLCALPLFILPMILSIYYQKRRMTKYASAVGASLIPVSALISYFCKTGTFYSGAEKSDAAFYVELAALFVILISECAAVVSVSVYSIKLTNFQKSLASTVAKDERLGVFSRGQFQLTMKQRLERGDMLVVTDIVKFSVFNELFGHEAGDKLLKGIADLLIKYTGENGIVGRLGDDHLIFLIQKGAYDPEKLVSMLFHNEELAGNLHYTVDIICGVYEITDGRISAEVMCDRALMAVHSQKAKTEGLAVYRESMLYDARKSKEFLAELKTALDQNQFILFLQPQCTSDGTVTGAEVLSRWQHPDRGIVHPSVFIPICEEYGLISRLDLDIWEKAAETIADWNARGKKELSLSINLSLVDLYEMDVYKELLGITKKYKIDPKRLHLEITETGLMKDLKRMVEIIENLRGAGFIVEIDDFGNGNSSLGMLSEIEVDAIKLDISFIKRLETGKNAVTVLKIITELVKSLGTLPIVEGVENKEQLKILTEIGYEHFQGYYFGKPMSVSEFEEKFMQ